MTVGEKIQKTRKQLGMSQDELGQKLFVSRQTISLWENDQTVPTIDNLIRLKEVFGVSVDELLCLEHTGNINKAIESYQFVYTKEELQNLHRLQRNRGYNKPISILCVCLILFIIGASSSNILIGLVFGILFAGLVPHLKAIYRYNKVWKTSLNQICKSTYEYKLYEKHIDISIYRNHEKVSESKYYYSDIEQIQQYGNWILLQFGGQSFIIRKNELKENSVIYSYMYHNPLKIAQTSIPNKWKICSVALFISSLLSILGALLLVSAVSSTNGLFEENMWLFFLMTPIPLASVIFGFVLKAKGYKFKKNIVAGIIMILLLCVYGSFTFIF